MPGKSKHSVLVIQPDANHDFSGLLPGGPKKPSYSLQVLEKLPDNLEQLHGVGRTIAIIILALHTLDERCRQFLQDLRGHPVLGRVPVAVVVQRGTTEHLRRCSDAGANSIIFLNAGETGAAEALESIVRYWTEFNQLAEPDVAVS
jgi:hypothetical protein